MTDRGPSVRDEHILASDFEAGTAPGDRRFRPDVEGLRAVAILLVVLYHAGLSPFTGGFVGVDVFFVISGFVITGLLLREREATDRTSLVDFYARRVRRILPMATVVIVVTVVAAYELINVVNGISTANDGRWAAVFLSNFHFEQVGTNYFTASLPPSPLQNYWSLSVEEQFYLVYPTIVFVVAATRTRFSLRAKLAGTLGIVIVASFALSVAQTATHPATAYFSPFTRAWELAIGGLVAVATPQLKQLPRHAAAAVTWVGCGAILWAACTFDAQKVEYPGSLVAVPVLGAVLIIAGGVAAPVRGAESLLGLGPFQWLGRRSYSLYLWHWPILVLAAQSARATTLPVGENLALLAVALGLSTVTYAIVENPIRHWKLPSRLVVISGIVVIAATLAVLSLLISSQKVDPLLYPVSPASTTQVVIDQVASATGITKVPASIEPPLAADDRGVLHESPACEPRVADASAAICTLGDQNGKGLIVLYGDSHALMWIPAFDDIARHVHSRLVVLAKPGCPAGFVTVVNLPGTGPVNGPFSACDQWHQWAIGWINRARPSLLVVTQRSGWTTPNVSNGSSRPFTEVEWERGLTTMFRALHLPATKQILLGNSPELSFDPTACLFSHQHDVQACSEAASRAVVAGFNGAERSAAQAVGAGYIDVTPWFCSTTCPAIVDHYRVYADNVHITGTYSRYLEVVLQHELLPASAASG
jgi:peptidoglycan/LPS O-acetylase OafA/YrhL